MHERVYKDGKWQNSFPLFASSKRAISQQRYGVETVGGILVTNQDAESVPTGKVRALFVCGKKTGEAACSHMITVLDDGSQLRERRSEAMTTLAERALNSSVELVVANCDVHGGLPFPPTQAITEELQRFSILDETL